jgi:predicted AlkP superfamily pyrophosphatase or phosphodiesterase
MLARGRFLLFTLVLLGTAAFKPSTPPKQRNAILISWDGALREHVQDALKRGQLPHMARLINEGRIVDVEVTGHATDTRPGHAQMLTGYDPEITGVYTNSRFRPIPLGLSLFERLHQTFGKKDLATIMITGKPMGLGPGGPKLPPTTEATDSPSRRNERIRLETEQNVAGQPFHLIKDTLTSWDGDSTRDALRVGTKVLRTLDKVSTGRFFLFIHFGDADVAGHTYGEDSQEYDQALVALDGWLGRIVDKLKSTGAYDRTPVYITADHGFDVGTTHHGQATHIFLAGNDPGLVQHGEQRDITPTVLQALGVNLAKLTPALPGKSLRKEPEP